MITFILIGAIVILAIGFALMAYSANNRKRAGQKDIPAITSEQPQVSQRPAQGRASGDN